MADGSKIEWTDASWNPIRARNKKTGKLGWHCEHATTGCAGCYAGAFNQRLGTGLPFKPGHLDNGDVELILDERMLNQPLGWKRPRKVFVCSMTDLFARFVLDAWLDRIFAVMALTPQHTYQLLTKRSDRMRRYFAAGRERLHTRWLLAAREVLGNEADGVINGIFPLPNVWLGVSTERQREAEERIPDLLATPAAVRFVSIEPLLGPIDLTALRYVDEDAEIRINALSAEAWVENSDSASAYSNENDGVTKLDWIIVGGESGKDARPMHPDWASGLRDHCAAAGVAFFFKQWGEWAPSSPEDCAGNPRSGWQACVAHPHIAKAAELCPEAGAKFVARVGRRAAGRLLDGVEHNGFPNRSI
jgi:protein gp37